MGKGETYGFAPASGLALPLVYEHARYHQEFEAREEIRDVENVAECDCDIFDVVYLIVGLVSKCRWVEYDPGQVGDAETHHQECEECEHAAE